MIDVDLLETYYHIRTSLCSAPHPPAVHRGIYIPPKAHSSHTPAPPCANDFSSHPDPGTSRPPTTRPPPPITPSAVNISSRCYHYNISRGGGGNFHHPWIIYFKPRCCRHPLPSIPIIETLVLTH